MLVIKYFCVETKRPVASPAHWGKVSSRLLSGNQTWQLKITDLVDDVSIKTSISFGDFPARFPMCEKTRGFI